MTVYEYYYRRYADDEGRVSEQWILSFRLIADESIVRPDRGNEPGKRGKQG